MSDADNPQTGVNPGAHPQQQAPQSTPNNPPVMTGGIPGALPPLQPGHALGADPTRTRKVKCFTCELKVRIANMSNHRSGRKGHKKCDKWDGYFDKDGWTPKAKRILCKVHEKSLKPSAWKGGGAGTSYVYLSYNGSRKPRFGKTNTERKHGKRSAENECEKGETLHIPLICDLDDESAAAAEAGLIQCFEIKTVTRNRKYEYVADLPPAYETHADMHEVLLRILKGKLEEHHPFTTEDLQGDEESSIDSADDPDLRIADDLLADQEKKDEEINRRAAQRLDNTRRRRKSLREESAERKRRRLNQDV